MVSRHKDFGVATVINAEPVTFSLRKRDFVCEPAVSGHAILTFMSATGSGDGQVAADAILEFIEEALTPESYDEFQQLAKSRKEEDNVDLQELLEIAAWLVEVYSERPTQPPSKSVSGRKPAGRSSTANSSRQVSTA